MALADFLQALLRQPGGPQNALAQAASDQGSAGPNGSAAYQNALQAAFQQQQQPQSAPQTPAQGVSSQMTGSVQPSPQGQPMPAPAAASGGNGLSSIFTGLQSLLDPQARGRNMTIQYLTQKGYDPGTAQIIASDKPLLRQALIGGGSDFDKRAKAAQSYGLTPGTEDFRNFVLTGKLDGSGDQTSDMKEYQTAVKQGFKGTLMDFMVKMKEAGRNQLNINTGVKLPAGYQWIDPNDQDKGVKPIAGGPATTIPAESAGRIGLADTFLANYPTLREKVLSGAVTGPLDRFEAKNVSNSASAEIYRQIQSGVDSLQRMLTGAGMPASEAQQYAFRYLPTYTDDAQSMAGKLDRLANELKSVKTTTLRGRGDNIPLPPSQDDQERQYLDKQYQGGDGWTDLGNGVRVRKLN